MSHLPGINSQSAHFTVAQFFGLVKVQISEILMIRRASIGDKTDYRMYVAATPKEQNHDSANQADHLTAKIEPVRVLQVVTIMNRAGLETMLMNYYRHIDRTKVQFDFLVHRAEKGHYDDEILSLGGKIHRFDPITLRSMVGYSKKMKNFLQEHPEYSVVHSHIDALSVFPLSGAKRAGVAKRIAHSHNSNFDKDAKIVIRYALKSFIRFYATDIMGCSKAAIRFMFGRRVKDYTVINNAIDVDKFTYNETVRKEMRKKLGLDGKFVLGHVGRFSYQKNHEFLIDVFNEVNARNPESVLMLVGAGEGEQAIKNKVKDLKLEDKVLFLGLRTDIPDLMQAMDVFVMPSRFEGLPVVSIEAQASGLPCVFSDVVTKDLNITGLCEFVSLDSNTDAWVGRINRTRGVARNDTSKLIKKAGYSVAHQADEYIGMVL